MTNNHHLYYKPGLTMDESIPVYMAAADWAILMSWFSINDTDGINHIVYGIMSQQITDALYTPASLKAAKAAHAEMRAQQNPFHQFMQATGQAIEIKPEDFGEPEGNDE